MKKTVLLLALAMLAAVGSAQQATLRGVVYGGDYHVVVDSVMMMYSGGPRVHPTSGWAADSAGYDSTVIAEIEEWPVSGKVFMLVGGGQEVILTIDPLVPDTWYIPEEVEPESPALRFYRVVAAVGESPVASPRLRIAVLHNPTAGPVRLSANLPAGVAPSVEVFDGTGVLVRKLSGLVWDRRDLSGREVASGLYLLRVTVGSKSALAKVVVTD